MTDSPWREGHDAQMAWLRENVQTLEQAQRCLAERLATLGPEGADPYNDGGTAATREYVAEKERDAR